MSNNCFPIKGFICYNISYQSLVPFVVILCKHHCCFHRFILLEYCFYFAQLNPVAPDLYLLIHSPEIFYLTVFLPFAEITCLVHSCTWHFTKRICNKFLSCKIRTVQVTTSYLQALSL